MDIELFIGSNNYDNLDGNKNNDYYYNIPFTFKEKIKKICRKIKKIYQSKKRKNSNCEEDDIIKTKIKKKKGGKNIQKIIFKKFMLFEN